MKKNTVIILFSFLGTEPSLITGKLAVGLLHVGAADFQESIESERRGCPETHTLWGSPMLRSQGQGL